MGISWAWRYDLKMTDVSSVGNKSRGVQRGVATLPLQNQLMPSGILACILLQPMRRDNLTGYINKPCGYGESAEEISLSAKDDT